MKAVAEDAGVTGRAVTRSFKRLAASRAVHLEILWLTYLSFAQSVMPRRGAPSGMKEDILGEKAARLRTGR